MLTAADVAYVSLAINPVGGLLLAIPFAALRQHYPAWLTLTSAVPLGYVQVLAVDAAWSLLVRIPWWRRTLEKQRSPRVQRLVASRGGFWLTFIATPFLGPWLVMALMRYADVPQRRVALPILLALACTAAALLIVCLYVPSLVTAPPLPSASSSP